MGPQIPVVGVAFLQFGKNLCKESLINDENWKNAYTKGYVLSFIIGGGGGGQWLPWFPPPPPPNSIVYTKQMHLGLECTMTSL